MMKHFLEIKNRSEITDKQNTTNYVFTNTKIYKEQPEFFKLHFSMYLVIFIDYRQLRDVGSYEEMLLEIRSILMDTFSEHS